MKKNKIISALACALLSCILIFGNNIQIAAQTISTFAGSLTTGSTYSGDGGPATAAGIGRTFGVRHHNGSVYFGGNQDNVVRQVDVSTNIISTFAGIYPGGTSTGDGGPASVATFTTTSYICFDPYDNMYISDANRIRKIDPSGTITTYAGTGTGSYSGDGGPATAADLSAPAGLTTDNSGNLFFCDYYNNVVRRVDATTHIITTVVGNGINGFSGDGGPATNAEFGTCYGVAVDGAGNIYITDAYNARIRRVDASTGIVSTYAGVGTAGNTGDGGPATAAQLNFPVGINIDGSGNILFCDFWNSTVREINTSGIISTVAGNGTAGYSGDGGPATDAQMYGPADVDIDCGENIYISEDWTFVVRKVSGFNSVPSFIYGPSTSFTLCGFSGAYDISSLLAITDADAGQSETWSIVTGPSHGTLGGFTYTSSSTGGTLTPTGMTYTPTPGYGGSDNFVVKITDCTGLSSVITITVSVGPGAISGVTSICWTPGAPPGTTTLSDATTGGTWSSSDISVATINATTGVVTSVGAGTTIISYTVPGSSCIPTISVSVVPPITGVAGTCIGVPSPLYDISGGAWTCVPTTVATVDPLSGVITGVSAGSAVVTYTLGTCVYTMPVVIFGSASISGPTTVCSGSTITLTGSPTSPYSTWSIANPAIATISWSTGSPTAVVTGVSGGYTTVFYYQDPSIACSGTSRDVVVTPLPTAISGPSYVCVGSTITLSDGVPGGIWGSSNTAIATVNSSGIVTGVHTGTVTIGYSTGSGCNALKTVTVFPVPAAIGGSPVICTTGGSTTLTDATTGGTWSSHDPTIVSINSSTGVATDAGGGPLYDNVSTIYYTITTTGCRASIPVTVVYPVTGVAGTCPGATTPLYGTVGGSWTSAPTTIATVDHTTGVVTGVGAGSAVITYTLGSCVQTFPMTVVAAPTISGLSSVIAGNTISLTGSPSTSYSIWSNSNPTDASISWTTGGSTCYVTGNVAGTTVTISYQLDPTMSCTTGTMNVTVTSPKHTPDNNINNGTTSVTALSLFPNPNKGSFNIAGTLAGDMNSTEAELSVVDILGRTIYNDKATVDHGAINKTITLSGDIANGAYTVKIKTNEANAVLKFVVVR